MGKSTSSCKTFLAAILMVMICPGIQAAANYLFEGLGTEESPYQIPDAETLKYFAKQMQTYENYSDGKWFKLTGDIVLNDVKILDDEYNVVCDTTKLEKWTPISSNAYGKSFSGVFDGDGHRISGMYIQGYGKYDGYHGLFGILKDCTVKNVVITNSYIFGRGQLGAIVGYADSEKVNILNCCSYARIDGTGSTIRAGGIAGTAYESNISECENHGLVSINPKPTDYGEMWDCEAGGIVGYGGNVSGCTNYGHIKVETWGAAGGIAGGAGFGYLSSCVNYGEIENCGNSSTGGIAGHNSETIKDCENYGALITTGEKAQVGGICGNHWAKAKIYGCVNKADLTLDVNNSTIGGICGISTASQFGGTTEVVNIRDSYNYGNISVTGVETRVGGISGSAKDSKVVGCYNYGDVTSLASGAAGAINYVDVHADVVNCRNYGNVSGRGRVGGISCESASSIEGCFNSGNIIAIDNEGNAAGILASGHSGSSSVYVIDCVNVGQVQGGNICGISGNYTNSLNNCYNAGKLICYASNSIVGGLTLGNSDINMSYNVGEIYNYGDQCKVGGLSGDAVSSMVSSFNAGPIFNYGKDCVLGNLIGLPYQNNYKIRTNYYLSGMILSQSPYSGSSINESVRVDSAQNLTDALNRESSKWYYENYWAQGYFHPVLKNYYQSTERYNFNVLTADGDTVRVDLGRPFDNSLFTLSDDPTNCDLGTLCYNTMEKGANTVERFYLVDHKDFVLDKELKVKYLEYNRIFGKRPMSSLCLPFEVTTENCQSEICPQEISLYLPYSMADNTLFIDNADKVGAGHPFIVVAADSLLNANITKYDFVLSPVTITDGLVHGTFVAKETSPQDYIFNQQQQAFVKDQAQSISAFDTYLVPQNPESELINIDFVPSALTTVTMDTASNMRISDCQICFDSAYHIQIFDLAGRSLWHGYGDRTNPLPSGLYLVKFADKTAKVYLK